MALRCEIGENLGNNVEFYLYCSRLIFPVKILKEDICWSNE